MIDFLTAMIASVEGVIVAAIGAAAAIYVASVWWKTKALVPTMTAIVLAGVVVWAAGHIDDLERGVTEDSQAWLDASGDGAE